MTKIFNNYNKCFFLIESLGKLKDGCADVLLKLITLFLQQKHIKNIEFYENRML